MEANGTDLNYSPYPSYFFFFSFDLLTASAMRTCRLERPPVSSLFLLALSSFLLRPTLGSVSAILQQEQ